MYLESARKCERLSPLSHFFPISEFSYQLIRFSFHSSIIKSDGEEYLYGMSSRNVPVDSAKVGKYFIHR